MAAFSTQDVHPKAAQAILAEKGIRVLDVRTPEEFAAAHIPNAVNIPFMLRNTGALELNPAFLQGVSKQFSDKSEQFLVHCASGNRSRKACNELVKEYSGLVHLEGGMGAWQSEGLPVAQ